MSDRVFIFNVSAHEASMIITALELIENKCKRGTSEEVNPRSLIFKLTKQAYGQVRKDEEWKL